MTLVSLSLKNLRHSLRDYAVFFLTLVLGVILFYTFNAIGSQTTMLELTAERSRVVELMEGALTGVSLLVTVVLGLLVVYASRFLMKRRNREFALYLILGMEKRTVSRMLLLESGLLGMGALALGLALGIVLSQAMGLFVSSLLGFGGTGYHFVISGGSIAKTIVFFVAIYLVVLLLNSRAVSRMKLIDLLQSAKRSEAVRLENPVLCTIVLIIACALLGFAYHMVGWEGLGITRAALTFYIIIGGIATLLVFWSVSGLLLRIIMSLRDLYYRGLNSFTFRQVSSKINTVVFSMTTICLMLVFAICALASAFSLQGGMRAGAERCLADMELSCWEILPDDPDAPDFEDLFERYARCGYDLPSRFSDYVHFRSYYDPSAKLDGLGGRTGNIMHLSEYAEIIKLSDYNALMTLYGREGLSLANDEFVLLCDYEENVHAYDRALRNAPETTLFGHVLHAKYPTAQDGFVSLSSGRTNTGILVVPDIVVDESKARVDRLIGNYRAKDDSEREAIDAQCHAEHDAVNQMDDAGESEDSASRSFRLNLLTRIEMRENALGMGALMAVIGLYLGIVLLVASGAILALRGLSDSVDGISRYETLRKIGVDEDDIARSLFVQTSTFFLLPLALACIHSVFGMRFLTPYIQLASNASMAVGIIVTVIVISLVYGGYFAITYLGSLRIIQS